MSDVTGNLGSESIRLRGMALEETQYQIYQEISDLVSHMKGESKKPGKPGDKNDSNAKAGKKNIETANKVDVAFEAAKGTMKGFGATLSKAGDILKDFAGTTTRLARSYDSNIKSTDFALRQVAMGSKGVAGTIARFSADSVAQLEEQFDTYKKLTNVGGTTAAGFDDLRIKAASMGVTMQEYVGLVNSNLGSLRMGGTSVRKSLESLNKGVVSLRRSTNGTTEEFQNMGISTYDYAQHILDSTAALGGFGKSVDTESDSFQKQMLRTTKVTQGLAEAFGANRDELLKKTADAMKKPLNRAILNAFGIPPEVQKAKLEALMAIGMSEQMAIESLVAKAGGPVSEAVGLIESLTSGKLLGAVDTLTEEMVKSPDDLAGAVQRARDKMGPQVVQELQQVVKDLGPSISRLDPAVQGVVGMIQHFTDSSGDIDQIAKNLKEAREAQKGGSKELDALGQLQKRNVEMGITFAETTKVLNKFGLTAAFATQLVVRALGSAGSLGFAGIEKLIEEVGKDSKTGRTGHDILRDIMSSGDNDIRAIQNRILSQETGNRPSADLPTQGTIVGDRKINVQGQRVLASSVDSARTEATAGGPTNIYQKQSAVHLDKIIPNARFTAFKDTLNRGTKENPRGHGEFSIDVVPDSATTKDQYEELKKTFDNEMKALGMDNKDYQLINEFGVKGGSHLHLQFANEKAAKKYFDAYAKKYGSNTVEPAAPAPVVPAPPKNTSSAPVVPTSTSLANNATSTGTGSDTGVNTTLGKASPEYQMFAELVDRLESTIIASNSELKQVVKDSSESNGQMTIAGIRTLVEGA